MKNDRKQCKAHLKGSSANMQIYAASPPSPEHDKTAKDILSRSLSTRTIQSTTSSFAQRMNDARNKSLEYRCIGRGSFGTVYEIPGTERALKLSKGEDELFAEFNINNTVATAAIAVNKIMQRAFPDFTVPRIPTAHNLYISGDEQIEEVVEQMRNRFPGSVDTSEYSILEVDRILPLPKQTRNALIDLYFEPELRDEAKNEAENKDCLARVYLGRNGMPGPGNWRDSLRNFELNLDMAKDLKLDVEQLASEMAIGLAMIHWEAQVDAQDSEWVLGSAAMVDTVPTVVTNWRHMKATTIVDFGRRATHLWVLDFDKADSIGFESTDCIKQLLAGVTSHDPYFPNPAIDQELFNLFEEVYLKASEQILEAGGYDEKALELPKKFVEAYKNWAATDDAVGFEIGSDEEGSGSARVAEEDGGWGDDDVDAELSSDDESEEEEEFESDEEDSEIDEEDEAEE